MKRGSFNKIYKLGNLVIKIDTEKDSFSKIVMDEMDSKKYIRYEKDLNKCGIKTSKLYFYTTFPKTILIEKNIHGKTLQEIMNDKDVSIKDKLILIKKLLLIYKQTENSNVCIDCNLKNFILNKNDLVYIDFVPSLYKDKIIKSDNKRIEDYKKIYLSSNLQLISIMNYVLKSLIYLKKDELKEVRNQIIMYIHEIFELNAFLDSENVVVKKKKLINKYIEEDMSLVEFNKEYNKVNKR